MREQSFRLLEQPAYGDVMQRCATRLWVALSGRRGSVVWQCGSVAVCWSVKTTHRVHRRAGSEQGKEEGRVAHARSFEEAEPSLF